MFKSYEYLSAVVEGTNRFSYDMQIIDDEFVQNVRVSSNVKHMAYLTVPIQAVIMVYEQRHLPVPRNVARALHLMFTQRANWSTVEEIISENVYFNPLYGKYKTEVEKYLVLI